MSVYAGPNTNTNDLIFHIDAGNKRSYINGSNNIIDMVNNTICNISGVTFISNYFEFDGSNDFIDTSYDLSWNNTNSASIEILINSNITNQRAGIIGKPSPTWEWTIMHGNNNTTDNSLTFVYWNSAGGHTNGPIINISNFFNINEWIHLVLTWSHVENKIKIYKNSNIISNSNWNDASINQNRNNNVHLGGAIYSWNTGYWNGKIGYLKFYNKSLSPNEIKQNFYALRGRFNI